MNRQSLTACALALGLLAVSGRVAPAQDYGQNKDQNKGQNKDQHGQGNAQANQQHQSQPQQQARLRDEDRRATEDWYRQHHQQAPAGWRDQDRLPPSMQDRLRPGHTLDRDLRGRMRPVPAELSQRYAPPPRGYRYAVIGGNVVLLDAGYVVFDVFTISFQQQTRFRDEDRRASEDWYRQHYQQAPAGWRDQDRLPPSMQDRLRRGHPLDQDLRKRMHPLPSELARRYATPPRGYRYAVIGGNVVLLGNGYVVYDVFTITFHQQQARFRDEDRRATDDWYRQHHQQAPAGWRDQDRLPPSMQDRLRPGRPLDQDLRSRMQPLPSELSRRYAAPPRGYRYAVIGGNVVLVDDGYVVQDVFTVSFQIHF